jgi:hypothetical protein
VGKFIFLTTTRPDLAYGVNIVSRYISSLQQPHLEVVKHILRYLRKTADYGLFYSTGHHPIQGFTDADWASCPETRRSIGGYCFLIGGAFITWQSKRQMTVAQSSTESEYVSLSTCTQEAMWLSRLFTELGLTTATLRTLPLGYTSKQISTDISIPKTIIVHCDNQSTLKLANN